MLNSEKYIMTFYRIEENNIGIPDVAYCIRIDHNLKVMFLYRSSPISFPNWFRQSRNTIPNRSSMLTNFISHIKNRLQKKKTKFQKTEGFEIFQSNGIFDLPHPLRPAPAVYIASEPQAPTGGTATSLRHLPEKGDQR